jgi:hypothetical protein
MLNAIPMLELAADARTDGSAPLPLTERLRIVNELVAWALDWHRHLEAMDCYGPRNRSRWFLTKSTAAVFRRAHEEWLQQGQAVLSRATELRAAGHGLERTEELKRAVFSTKGLLKITVEAIERGMEDILQGNYVTLEEARRELRLAAQA